MRGKRLSGTINSLKWGKTKLRVLPHSALNISACPYSKPPISMYPLVYALAFGPYPRSILCHSNSNRKNAANAVYKEGSTCTLYAHFLSPVFLSIYKARNCLGDLFFYLPQWLLLTLFVFHVSDPQDVTVVSACAHRQRRMHVRILVPFLSFPTLLLPCHFFSLRQLFVKLLTFLLSWSSW